MTPNSFAPAAPPCHGPQVMRETLARRKMRRCIQALAGLLVLAGCQYNPYAHRFVTEEPDWAELEGTFRLTWQTLTSPDPAQFEGREPCIEIMPAGKFQAVNFPAWERHRGGWRLSSQRSIAGEWKGRITGGVEIGDDYGRTWGIRLNPHPAGDRPDAGWFDHPGDPSIGREDDQLQLIFTYGDPDAGAVAIFTPVQGRCAG